MKFSPIRWLALRRFLGMAAVLVWHFSAFGNEPPVITLATNEAILGENSAFELRFTVTDVDSTMGLTNIHALSLNSDLVPNAASNLMLCAGTNEGSFGLTIVPVTNGFGSALIVLSASDGENECTNNFVLQVRKTTVEPPNVSQIPIDDLLGYWPAENDARDALRLHDGSLINGTSFGPGTLGQAFEFDGQDDYVEIGSSSFYLGLSTTISTWIQPARLEQGKTIIAVKGEAGSLPKFELSLLADSEGVAALQVAMDTITNFITFSGTTSIKTGAWTHVAVSVSAFGLKLYVDGQLDVNLADPVWMSAGQEDPWWIGKGDGLCFHGRIDEFAWYGAPLSVEQIQSLYQLGKAGTAGPPQILRQPQGLSAGVGSVAEFSVVAASPGGLPLSYQWQFNGEDLIGEIENALSLKDLRLDQSGSYRVVVRNELGWVTSSAVNLAVSGLIAWGRDMGCGELNVPKDLMNIVAIAVGGERNLVLRSDGTLFSWGSRITGVLEIPLGETNLLSMSTDGADTFLVYPNREVYRLNSVGTLTPTGWKDVVAFSANGNRQMALKSDGTVRAWNVLYGWNYEYDTAWLTNAVAAAAGANHCVALRADGTVVTFGADIQDGSMYGQTNIPPGLSNVVAIATSYYHNLALKADGTLVAWGGYLDAPWYTGWNDWMTNTPPEATNLVAISAGQTCNLALRADGRVIQWGSSGWGWTNGSPNFPNAVAIGVGSVHALMLLKDGTPQVTVQPWDQTVAFGGESSFAAKVVGKQGMTYQWEFNGTSISGATNGSYRLKDAKLADEGVYSVTASNPMGTVTSRKAKLVVKDDFRPVQLSPVSITGGGFVLRINGSVGLSYIIQTSADLRAWSNISTSTPTAGVWDFIDPDSATATNRFYRVQLAP